MVPGQGLELLTTAEMGEADGLASSFGVASTTLMEHAGRAVAEEALRMLPDGGRVAIVCGPGNNGGDGFVAARHLMGRACPVRLVLLGSRDALRGDAAIMADQFKGEILDPGRAAEVCEGWADLVIDALFGAGLSRPLEGLAAALVETMNSSGKPILAVDVPSGLDGTTGALTGPAVRANRTVTFFRRKPGHLLLPGRLLCGDVALYDIGMPEAVLAKVKPRAWANAPGLWWADFPRLRLDGHKYTRGHAVVVSGGIEMSGAARLAARGALRCGAGLVTVASPPESLQAHAAQLNATLIRAIASPGSLSAMLGDPRFTAVGIGPGLGRGRDAREWVMAALGARAAIVLDADGLTVSADDCGGLFGAIATRGDSPVVLTPHEGEFKRLFPGLSGDKLARAREAARVSGAIVVLKGADTIIAAPDGQAAINDNAPANLATAGSGDVLTGFITGLLAQGMAPFEAACAGVWLHGACAKTFGAGLIAEDLPEMLPTVLGKLGG